MGLGELEGVVGGDRFFVEEALAGNVVVGG